MNSTSIMDNIRGIKPMTAAKYMGLSFVLSTGLYTVMLLLVNVFTVSVQAKLLGTIFIVTFTPIVAVTLGFFALFFLLMATGHIKNDY